MLPHALFLIALLVCAGAAAEDAPDPCTDRLIVKLRVSGCENVWCNDPVELDKLYSLTSIRVGDKWTRENAQRAIELLRLTGFFRQVTHTCQPVNNGAAAVVVFSVAPNRWIRRVDVRGNSALFKSDIKKRLLLRTGMAFNPSTTEGKDLIKRQQDAIQRLYQREGFGKTIVRIETKSVKSDGVDVAVNIEEGRKAKIIALVPVINRRPVSPADRAFGQDIQCPRVSRRQTRIATGLSVGEVVTERRLRKARREVRGYLRGLGFIDPKVILSHDADSGSVRIEANFDRCFVLRFKVRDDSSTGPKGYVDDNPERFGKELTFAQSGNFDMREAEDNRAILEAWYQTQGYLFVDVKVTHRRSRNKPSRSAGVHGVVTYYTTRNYISEIRRIDFTGNRAISDELLRNRMQTQSYDFFGEGGYLLVDQMFADLQNVRNAYRDRGYYAMRFKGAPQGDKRERTISVAVLTKGNNETFDYTYDDLRFRVKKRKGESVIYLQVPINEGKRSRIGQIDIAGWPDVATLRTQLALQPGSPFSYTGVTKDRGRIVLHFQRLGYHQVKIETGCSTDTQTADVCNWENVRAPMVNISHTIIPGEQFVVGEIFLRGNYATKAHLVTDELPAPGEPLDRVRLEQAERRLRSLGVFSGVRINPIGLDVKPPRRKVALVTIVQERRAQFLDVSGGFESLTAREGDRGLPVELTSSIVSSVGLSDSILRGPSSSQSMNVPDLLMVTELKYRHRNFLGRAMEFQVPVKYGFSTGFTKDDMHRLGHVSATVYDPFLFGSDYALETTIFGRYDRATKEEDEYEFGGQIALHKTFFKRLNSRLQFTASGIQTGDFLRDPLPGEDLPFTPLRPKLEVAFQSSLDFLDNPANPTRGFAVGASVAYINISDVGSQSAETEVFGNFLRWEASARLFVNLRRTVILALLVRYGGSFSFTEDNLPQVKRFRLGGIWGVRGFEDDSIAPTLSSGDPNPGELPGGDSLLTGTIELRFPLLRRLNLWGATFFDVGALAESSTEFHARSFRTSVGVGLRYLFLGQVPLRLDLAVNLDRRCVKDQTDLGSECELEPLAVPQFSLLYTF